MKTKKEFPISTRLMFLALLIIFGIASIIASAPPPRPTYYPRTYTTYSADYQISLIKVERPEKATVRYGVQKVDAVTTDTKYKYAFEDDMVRILWFVNSQRIAFLLQNKTDYSIKIPWDEAAYVDEIGRSHRVMHRGVKYTDKDKPQPPSVIVRRGSIEDIIHPTDYVDWLSGTSISAGRWKQKSLLLDWDFGTAFSEYSKYSSIDDFEKAVKMNIGKQIQVLLPLQIQDVINDYIFTFNVDSVTASSKER